jgi:hypothetical protein
MKVSLWCYSFDGAMDSPPICNGAYRRENAGYVDCMTIAHATDEKKRLRAGAFLPQLKALIHDFESTINAILQTCLIR